ncbi:hypothetical protein AABB24_014390 [Solanum stoloniferum]
MSPHRKEFLLSQLREKRATSKRQKSLLQSNNTAALTITTSSLSPPQSSKPTSLPGATTRGEHIVSCLSTFELGSTSAASHVATKLAPPCTANKVLFSYSNDLMGKKMTIQLNSIFAIGETLHSIHRYLINHPLAIFLSGIVASLSKFI